MRDLLGNAPVIVGLTITLLFSVDPPFIRSLKSEGMFDFWLVIMAPAALMLLMAQLAPGLAVPWMRPWRRFR